MTVNKKLLSLYLCFCLAQSLSILSMSAHEHDATSFQHLHTAKACIDKGQYEQARIELEAGLKHDPKSPDILNNLGGIYIHLSQSRKDPNKRTSDLNTARTYFTSAININPDFPAAWNGLADVYYLGGQTRQAIAYYKKALSFSPKNAYEPQTNLANALRDLGLTQEAQNNYQKAIEINPLYAPAHNGYAELLLNKNDLSQAYSEAVEAIRLKPNYATAYYHLGLIENGQGHKEAALKSYLLSLRYEKNSKYAQETQDLINKLGLDTNSVSFEDLKRFQLEISQSLTASSQDSEIKESPTTSNTAPNAKTLPAGSTLNSDKLSLNKDIAQPNITAIESLIANKQWTQANKAISTLLKAHPNEPVLLNEYGLVLFQQKKYANAEAVLKQALFQGKNRLTAAYYNLGQVYLAKHDLIKAESCFKKAKDLNQQQHENCALIENSLAIIFKKQGNLAAAQASYLEAIRHGGDAYPVIHYNLAILLAQMNKPKEASEQFKIYIQLAPNGLNVKEAQKRLRMTL